MYNLVDDDDVYASDDDEDNHVLSTNGEEAKGISDIRAQLGIVDPEVKRQALLEKSRRARDEVYVCSSESEGEEIGIEEVVSRSDTQKEENTFICDKVKTKALVPSIIPTTTISSAAERVAIVQQIESDAKNMKDQDQFSRICGSEEDKTELDATSASNKNSLLSIQSTAGNELRCALCLRMLFKPVTTSCGHNFCRCCLVEALLASDVSSVDEENMEITISRNTSSINLLGKDKAGNISCPICRKKLCTQCIKRFQVNRTLWKLIQLLFPKNNIQLQQSPLQTFSRHREEETRFKQLVDQYFGVSLDQQDKEGTDNNLPEFKLFHNDIKQTICDRPIVLASRSLRRDVEDFVMCRALALCQQPEPFSLRNIGFLLENFYSGDPSNSSTTNSSQCDVLEMAVCVMELEEDECRPVADGEQGFPMMATFVSSSGAPCSERDQIYVKKHFCGPIKLSIYRRASTSSMNTTCSQKRKVVDLVDEELRDDTSSKVNQGRGVLLHQAQLGARSKEEQLLLEMESDAQGGIATFEVRQELLLSQDKKHEEVAEVASTVNGHNTNKEDFNEIPHSRNLVPICNNMMKDAYCGFRFVFEDLESTCNYEFVVPILNWIRRDREKNLSGTTPTRELDRKRNILEQLTPSVYHKKRRRTDVESVHSSDVEEDDYDVNEYDEKDSFIASSDEEEGVLEVHEQLRGDNDFSSDEQEIEAVEDEDKMYNNSSSVQ